MALFPVLLPLLGATIALVFIAPRVGAVAAVSQIPFGVETVRNPAAKSLFLFFPLYLGRLAFLQFSQLDYATGELYLRYLVADILGPFLFLSVTAFFLNRRLRQLDPVEQFLGYLSFFTVALTLIMVADSLLNDGYWTLYELFLRPVIYLVFLWLFPLAITRADTANGGGWAVLYLVGAPFLAALVPMWAEWLRPAAAIAATVTLVSLVAAALYLEVFQSGSGGSAGAHASSSR